MFNNNERIAEFTWLKVYLLKANIFSLFWAKICKMKK